MRVFKTTNNNQLKHLNVFEFPKERDLQQLIEKNLLETLDLQFLSSEYTTTSGGRIDTLAVDSDGSPVIIEYKKSKSEAVINQVLSYMRWLQHQKSEFFEKLMIDKLGPETYKKIGLDWKKPKAICIAEMFNQKDIDTVYYLKNSIHIELIRYRFYDDGIFTLEQIKDNAYFRKIEKGVSQILSEQNGATTKKPKIEDKTSKVEDFFKESSQHVREIFYAISKQILDLDFDIIEHPTNSYIGYKLKKLFAELHVQKDGLKIILRSITYKNTRITLQQVPKSHGWTLDTIVKLTNL